jgi:hypothetical protein
VGLLQSPNLMIFALFLKYQTDSSRSGLESGIQIYQLGDQIKKKNLLALKLFNRLKILGKKSHLKKSVPLLLF